MSVMRYFTPIFVLLPAAAAAQEASSPALAPSPAAYCEWVRSAAESESAPLLSPSLFLHFGAINGAGFLSPDLFTPPPTTFRLTAGARFSAGRLFQGLVLRERARAECDRYAAVSDLFSLVYGHRALSSRAALQAKVAVLREALPAGERILQDVQAALAEGTATIEEVDGTRLRLERLRTALSEASAALAGLPEIPAPRRTLTELLAARARAEEQVERKEAELRRAQSWDVTIQGGYDQIFGAVNQLPAFGMISASFNPALLWQPRADGRARKARLDWVAAQVEGASRRAEAVVAELRAVLRAEQARLTEVTALVADLEARRKGLEALGGKKVARYREHLFFEQAQARAEQAYLQAHVRDLGALLGPEAR
ncbi:MAG: hypothetical protein RMK29_08870 [Myxococcales bacterium]|nr:hypothetical protein [Myxococcales bacterium]